MFILLFDFFSLACIENLIHRIYSNLFHVIKYFHDNIFFLIESTLFFISESIFVMNTSMDVIRNVYLVSVKDPTY